LIAWALAGMAQAQSPVSDDFNTSSLNTGLWTLVNPVGNGSLSMTGTQLKLTIPAGSNHDPAFGGVNNSMRVVQSVAHSDFVVTAKFDSIPTASQQYVFEGILAEQDASHYIFFQIAATGSSLVVDSNVVIAGVETGKPNAVISASGAIWLRVQRTGNTWTES